MGYSEGDTEVLGPLGANDLKFVRNMIEQRLAALNDNIEVKEHYLQTVHATRPDAEAMHAMKQELGEWVASYLHNNGYLVGLENPQVFKGLFMKSFPRIIDGTELTVENVEDVLVRYAKVLNHHVEVFGNDDKKLGILE